MIREYDITFIAKEFLARNNWQIIAFNPPGSQGTFTIPNPEKDPSFRGQTGSLSPDIIALKKVQNKNIFLIVESKSIFKKEDVVKMISMFSNNKRKKVFFNIAKGYAIANNIKYNENLQSEIHFAKAHSGNEDLVKNLSTIHIRLLFSNYWAVGNYPC